MTRLEKKNKNQINLNSMVLPPNLPPLAQTPPPPPKLLLHLLSLDKYRHNPPSSPRRQSCIATNTTTKTQLRLKPPTHPLLLLHQLTGAHLGHPSPTLYCRTHARDREPKPKPPLPTLYGHPYPNLITNQNPHPSNRIQPCQPPSQPLATP